MNNATGSWLICYDIASKSRLRKVHNFLRQEALALHRSVFYSECSRAEITELKYQLRGMINEKYDDVRIFPQKASTPIRWQGCSPLPKGIDFQPGPELVNWDGTPFLSDQRHELSIR